MASSLCLGGVGELHKKPPAAPPQPLDKTKKKKKKRNAGALAGVELTEEDQLLSLMDEMGAAIKGVRRSPRVAWLGSTGFGLID